MNCTRALVVLLLSLWGAENAQAQPGESTPISALNQALSPPLRNLIVPDLPTADMRMSWNDFKELLVRIQLPPRAEAKSEEAPLPWTLSGAKYRADARVPGAVRVEGTLEVQVWKKGWVQIPVLGAGVALDSAVIDGAPSFLTSQGEWFNVLLDQPGPHTLDLVFYVPVQAKDGVVSFEFPCATTPVTQMNLTLDVPEARVSSPTAASVRTKKEKEGLTADLVFRSATPLRVQWELPAAALPKEPEPEKELPRVTCFGSTLATISESHVACESFLQYDVLRGEVSRFTLRLPSKAQVLHVEGTGTEWTSKEEGGVQYVTVNVNHAVKDHFAMALAYEAPIPAGAAAVTVPPLEALEVARQTGFVAVATSGNLEVEANPELSGLERVDTADLPAALKSQSFNPILHAFRYAQGNYLLALDYHKLEDVPVRVASIDHARLTSVITEEGLLVTRAAYVVRNNLKKFLRLEIGADAEVWGAQVGGNVVRPARTNAEESGGEGGSAILIPLLKSTESRQTAGAFPVEVVYLRRLPKLGAWWDTLALDAPQPDILADRVEWEVLLPEGKRVCRTAGDLKSVPRLGPMPGLSRTATGVRLPDGTVTVGEETPGAETIFRLRQGIERFLITDINNPAASARMAGDTSRFDGKQTTEVPKVDVPQKQTDAMVAGVLPIEVDLPRVGHSYYFERLIVPQLTPLKLTLYAYDGRIARGARGLAYLVPFVLGVFAALAVRCAVRNGRISRARRAVLAVALAVLLLLGNSFGAGFFRTLTWVFWGAVCAGAVLWVIKAARSPKSPEPSGATD